MEIDRCNRINQPYNLLFFSNSAILVTRKHEILAVDRAKFSFAYIELFGCLMFPTYEENPDGRIDTEKALALTREDFGVLIGLF